MTLRCSNACGRDATLKGVWPDRPPDAWAAYCATCGPKIQRIVAAGGGTLNLQPLPLDVGARAIATTVECDVTQGEFAVICADTIIFCRTNSASSTDAARVVETINMR
jgi:hypothetical protein